GHWSFVVLVLVLDWGGLASRTRTRNEHADEAVHGRNACEKAKGGYHEPRGSRRKEAHFFGTAVRASLRRLLQFNSPCAQELASSLATARSAAVLGSSNVSTPNTRRVYQISPAFKPAAPEDGRTPLTKCRKRSSALRSHSVRASRSGDRICFRCRSVQS